MKVSKRPNGAVVVNDCLLHASKQITTLLKIKIINKIQKTLSIANTICIISFQFVPLGVD